MTNRVVLGPFDNTFVLRASVPGSNVLDVSLPTKNLAFDTRWNSAASILQSGTVRGHMDRADMVGMSWTGKFTVPPGFTGIPLIICQAWPEFSTDFRVQTLIGGLGGGYDDKTGVVTMTAEAAWYPQNNGEHFDFGYFRYHLLRL